MAGSKNRLPWGPLGVMVGLLLLVAVAWAMLAKRAAAPRAYNVVVVMADTLRADHLSAWGYDRATSPNIDRLFVADGVTFYKNRSQASCTYPSVNSLLTSRYPAPFLDQPEKRMGIPEGIPSLAEILQQRGYSTFAVSASPIVRNTGTKYNNQGGFGRGFDAFDEVCLWKDARCVNEHFVPLLDNAREPFLAYVHYMDAHDPYRPPGYYQRRFATDGVARIEFARNGNPNPIADAIERQRVLPEYDPLDLEFLVDLYDDEISFLDGEIAVLMGDLASRGLLDRTIVVLVADHGEQFLEHGYMKHCYTLFDTDIQTPLAFRIPGIDGGLEVNAPVENVDVVPTLLDYLGVDTQELALEGHSLRPLIEGRSGGGPELGYAFAMQGSRRTVTDARHKLRYNARKREFALHDLVSDPHELYDVLPENPEVFLRMQQVLQAWEARIAQGKSADELVRAGEEVQERLRALGYLQSK